MKIICNPGTSRQGNTENRRYVKEFNGMLLRKERHSKIKTVPNQESASFAPLQMFRCDLNA